jgi:hypothetical protein
MNRDEHRKQNRKAWATQTKAKRVLAMADSLGPTLQKAISRELVRHPSLINIFQLPVLPDGGSVELLEQHGIKGFQIHYWDTDDERSSAGGTDGGFMQAIYDQAGAYRTVIFLARKNRDDMKEADTFNNIANLAVLYHELGHVDDFEKRINFQFSKKLDMTQAELYAHHFGCRRLKEEGLRMPLAMYIGTIIKHFESAQECERDAVKQFWKSSEFKSYVRYAEPFQRWWPIPTELLI